MRVNIIGSGRMGRSLAIRALTGGNAVRIVNPATHSGQPVADEMAQRFPHGDVEFATTAGVAKLTVFALPYDAALRVAKSTGAELAGQVVVDICNPVDFATTDGLVTAPGTSAAERIQQLTGPAVRVVKAFNTTFATLLADGAVHGVALDVFIAGDDLTAKATVAEFVRSGQMRPLDVGPLRRARELEATQFLHMAMQQQLNLNMRSAIKIVT